MSFEFKSLSGDLSVEEIYDNTKILNGLTTGERPNLRCSWMFTTAREVR